MGGGTELAPGGVAGCLDFRLRKKVPMMIPAMAMPPASLRSGADADVAVVRVNNHAIDGVPAVRFNEALTCLVFEV